MPCRPPLIQSFHRSSRRLLRHPLMQEIGIQFLRAAIRSFVRRFALERLAPPLAQLDVMQHLVNRAQRMVDSGRRPWSVHTFLSCFIRRTLVLMTSGLLCGQHRPEEEDTFCTICQSGDDDGSWWWWAYKCEHHFHEGCMFAHLAFDTRCPLCRAAIWWACLSLAPRAQPGPRPTGAIIWASRTRTLLDACSRQRVFIARRLAWVASTKGAIRTARPHHRPPRRPACASRSASSWARRRRHADHPRPIGPRTQSAVISHGLHACASSATTQHLSARWNRRPGEGRNTFHTVMTHWWVSEDAVGRCPKACATISGDSALRLSSPGAKINVCKTT